MGGPSPPSRLSDCQCRRSPGSPLVVTGSARDLMLPCRHTCQPAGTPPGGPVSGAVGYTTQYALCEDPGRCVAPAKRLGSRQRGADEVVHEPFRSTGRMRRLMAPPVFEGDEERTLLAGLLHPILLSTLLGVALYAAIASVHRERLTLVYAYCGSLGALVTVLLVATRRGHVRVSARALVAGVWLVLVSGASVSGGVLAAAFSGMLVVVLFAGVLLGPGSALFTAALSIAAGAVMLADPRPPPGTAENVRHQAFLASTVYMVVAAILLSAVMRAMRGPSPAPARRPGSGEPRYFELHEAQTRRVGLIGELEAKNAELEGFTYTVSHDLRSPLVTVKGFVAHLGNGPSGRRRGEGAGRPRAVQGAADTMDRLLRDLLELSRVGRIVNPPSDLALEDVVREALFLSQGRLARPRRARRCRLRAAARVGRSCAPGSGGAEPRRERRQVHGRPARAVHHDRPAESAARAASRAVA